jgi:putative nucleotidyltransferase with HDIG domain
MFGLRSRVISIEQAAVLLGAERLRNLALTSSMVEFASKALPETQMNSFWQHSFMAAMLSQYLADRRRYSEKDQVYIAGLLHDIGQIPQWMLVIEDEGKSQPPPPSGWVDNLQGEREYFGIDHCELGGSMASYWDFLPSFVDVVANHHSPEHAKHDKILVRLVAAIELFLLRKDYVAGWSPKDLPLAEDSQFLELTQKLTLLLEDLFGKTEQSNVEEAVQREYMRLEPLVRTGLKGVLARDGE